MKARMQNPISTLFLLFFAGVLVSVASMFFLRLLLRKLAPATWERMQNALAQVVRAPETRSTHEPYEQPKKPDFIRALLLGWGFGCLGVFFWGLAETLWASESGITFGLVYGILGMILGGLGVAYVGKVIFTKPN